MQHDELEKRRKELAIIIHCKNCNEAIDHVEVDGSWFGEGLLDGIFFKITKAKEGIGVQIEEKDIEYVNEKLNRPHWSCKAIDFLDDTGRAICPNCKQEFIVDLKYREEKEDTRTKEEKLKDFKDKQMQLDIERMTLPEAAKQAADHFEKLFFAGGMISIEETQRSAIVLIEVVKRECT